MRRLLLLIILLPVAACAQSRGSWPSLQPRPEEQLALAETAAAAVPPPPASVGTGAATADAAARLATIDRDLTALAARWQTQAAATTAATTTARGARVDSDVWSAAQLELSRLGQVGNQIGDLRDRLDAVAGDLALAAHGGADVSAPLQRTGALLARVKALQDQHRAAFDAASAALPSR